MPDHSAIGCVRAGPDHRAVISASVVGEGHAGSQAAEDARADQDPDARGGCCEDRGGDRQGRAQHKHQLAPVAVAERTEVEHRGGETEREADRDQVERGL